VEIDSAAIAVTERGKDWVQGYLLAVHGLPQDAAQHFDMQTLHALGLAAHVKGYSPPPHLNRDRYQLTQGGRIERDAR